MLFGVFLREKFKVIRNLSSAVNLTCYHGFYPNLFGQQFCDALFLYFQSRAARQILGLSMRHYGDGLGKFEPNDLNRALAPSQRWFSKLDTSVIKKAIDYCRVNNSLPEEMEVIFDSLTRCPEQDHPAIIRRTEEETKKMRIPVKEPLISVKGAFPP